MKVSGIEIAVERKAIKHTHLSVFPPDGRAHVSAPLDLPDADLRSFLVSKVPWLRRQIAAVRAQPRQTPRRCESGESIYVFGRRYRLDVRPGKEAARIRIAGNALVLEGRGLGGRDARAAKLDAWFRDGLRRAVECAAARCAELPGEGDVVFAIRRMRTRWGACNAAKRRIALNPALVHVPRRCIEYVVVHELVHLLVPDHSPLFERAMDRRMPRWREIRTELNAFIAPPWADGKRGHGHPKGNGGHP